uniref:MULE transposase domain-containing protein n=1 Tax=Lactuca sativa TaxID=4236 RepID=A0A9R1XKV9_LACSA|nr:hypothetical protein LSAT_V11C300102780 [Lactuca sativa]
MYVLVFVPFTVIDLHKSFVNVKARLLRTKDVDSYKWLLKQFLKANSNKQPLLVLTDQDAAVKQAVDQAQIVHVVYHEEDAKKSFFFCLVLLLFTQMCIIKHGFTQTV